MSPRLLRTPRLELRPASPADSPALHALWMHPDVRRHLWDDAILPRSETEAIVARSERRFADQGHGLWLACGRAADGAAAAGRDAGSGDGVRAPLVGFCGFWHFHEPPELELLYGLARDAWGRGLATEMADAVLRFGFSVLGFDEVQASTDVANRASVAVMDRLGMRFHRRALTGPRQTVFYRLRREEYERRVAARSA